MTSKQPKKVEVFAEVDLDNPFADESTPTLKSYIATIHIIKNELGLTDAQYRTGLKQFGVTTSKDLTIEQAKQVINKLTIAKKNKYLDKRANDFYYPEWSRLGQINEEFKTLEGEGVPRELTGKMIGNKLGKQLLVKKEFNNLFTPDFYRDWKTGWLRYYNELTKSQKETFDSLSNEWNGTVNELVDTAKLL